MFYYVPELIVYLEKVRIYVVAVHHTYDQSKSKITFFTVFHSEHHSTLSEKITLFPSPAAILGIISEARVVRGMIKSSQQWVWKQRFLLCYLNNRHHQVKRRPPHHQRPLTYK